ncbi:hypothetical protein [Streptomyces sp. SID5643]|uniref:hypothetical protein n=1 Tax=Streptomyces sp. SID5643 TaxID=2690307 RepID=UPI001926CA66|nr:hypothetical protein [Streptomyces sp. SID5643]
MQGLTTGGTGRRKRLDASPSVFEAEEAERQYIQRPAHDDFERAALCTAVMTDDDGVLRTRWRTEP